MGPATLLMLLALLAAPRVPCQACLRGGPRRVEGRDPREMCPDLEAIIFAGVEAAVAEDPRMAASLLRLHFHDCFVNGCDASVLLDDQADFAGEKTAAPNANSLRGFDVVDRVKAELEIACPAAVSCADILAVAARDAVVLSDGPTWEVEMGRRDGLTASKQAANNNIPGPNSDLATVVSKFQNVGLNARDVVALSGAHTIGKARCTSFSSRLGGDSGGEKGFLASLQQLCSESGGGNATLAQLDSVSPATFDNQYYVNILSGEGLLASDQALVDDVGGTTGELVEAYAADPEAFFEDFKASMVRMGSLRGPSGNAGEIRLNCRTPN